MKIDTSTYYPKSPLGDEEGKKDGEQKTSSLFPETKTEEQESDNTVEDEEKISTEAGVNDNVPLSEPVYDPGEGERFLNNAATLLSWILVPLLMPVYGILLAFNLSILDYMPFTNKLTFTVIVAGINMVVPALLVILLKRVGVVDDLGLNGRKERLIPYIITIIAMGATAFFMWGKHAPMWLVMFFTGGALAGLINLLVNFKWKISAHSAAIAGIIALLIRMMHETTVYPSIVVWLAIWVGLAGLLGSARVWLGRHTVTQVFAGYAVGFLCVFFLTMIK
ncbi:MAG: phosphatase PAP2 family protein [Muribaculaceae bacterium]|nr:phosphatase PAP2 family protein [Muribaculaceae bacterium]